MSNLIESIQDCKSSIIEELTKFNNLPLNPKEDLEYNSKKKQACIKNVKCDLNIIILDLDRIIKTQPQQDQLQTQLTHYATFKTELEEAGKDEEKIKRVFIRLQHYIEKGVFVSRNDYDAYLLQTDINNRKDIISNCIINYYNENTKGNLSIIVDHVQDMRSDYNDLLINIENQKNLARSNEELESDKYKEWILNIKKEVKVYDSFKTLLTNITDDNIEEVLLKLDEYIYQDINLLLQRDYIDIFKVMQNDIAAELQKNNNEFTAFSQLTALIAIQIKKNDYCSSNVNGQKMQYIDTITNKWYQDFQEAKKQNDRVAKKPNNALYFELDIKLGSQTDSAIQAIYVNQDNQKVKEVHPLHEYQLNIKYHSNNGQVYILPDNITKDIVFNKVLNLELENNEEVLSYLQGEINMKENPDMLTKAILQDCQKKEHQEQLNQAKETLKIFLQNLVSGIDKSWYRSYKDYAINLDIQIPKEDLNDKKTANLTLTLDKLLQETTGFFGKSYTKVIDDKKFNNIWDKLLKDQNNQPQQLNQSNNNDLKQPLIQKKEDKNTNKTIEIQSKDNPQRITGQLTFTGTGSINNTKKNIQGDKGSKIGVVQR